LSKSWVLQSVIQGVKRTLEVPERSFVVFYIRDVPRIHQRSYISIFNLYLPGKWSNSWGRGGQTKRDEDMLNLSECIILKKVKFGQFNSQF
jgi:hypothetical protein